MRILTNVLLFLATVSALVMAQGAPSISQHFKPGDPIHYYVRFDGHPKFDKISIYLALQGDVKPDQPGLSNGFWTDSVAKEVEPGVFEYSGTIPGNAASGTWLLTAIAVAHDVTKKQYEYSKDFENKITIEIVNDSGYEFPKIKSVTPEPPK